MKLSSVILALLPLPLASAIQDCPLLGAIYPPPSPANISTTNLTLALTNALSSGVLGATGSSFSIEVFSGSQPNSFFTFYHSAPALNGSIGVKKVDGNSVYRIGSISKLFTVYTFLLEAGEGYFDDPVTKWVPELAAAAKKGVVDEVKNVDWSSITLGNLASHLSGLGRDYFLDEFLFTAPNVPWGAIGFPAATDNATLPCVLSGNCTRKEFFQVYTQRHPNAPSSSTPLYSNVPFQILAYALEGITGKSYQSLLKRDIIEPLKLKHTTYSAPASSIGVIPDAAANATWNLNVGEATPQGGMYSSSSDLSLLGHSILSHSLLTPLATRRWMKPHSHTSDPLFSAGAPWEIVRYQSPLRIIDLYGKDGGFGQYSAKLILIPDWDIGFIVNKAGGTQGSTSDLVTISNIIAANLFPAAEEAARAEADAKYAGKYASPDGKSSITLTTDPAKLGLGVTSWISNGVNMFAIVVAEGIATSPSVRMYPTGLESTVNGTTTVGWRMVIESGDRVPNGVFGSACLTWENTDLYMYDEVAIDDFTFVLGNDERAASVQPRVMHVSLPRV